LLCVIPFLRGTLVPHAEAEEEVLDPEWAKLVRFDGAAVPMVHDHEAIVARIGNRRPKHAGNASGRRIQLVTACLSLCCAHACAHD
jgi:hypothetical protein